MHSCAQWSLEFEAIQNDTRYYASLVLLHDQLYLTLHDPMHETHLRLCISAPNMQITILNYLEQKGQEEGSQDGPVQVNTRDRDGEEIQRPPDALLGEKIGVARVSKQPRREESALEVT